MGFGVALRVGTELLARPPGATSALRALLQAQSVAVIGASPPDGRGHIASKPLEYLLRNGYQGRVYPVNPRHIEIQGLRCYSSIAAVEEPVDAALLMVRSEIAASVVAECAQSGVKVAVVCSGGFAEQGGAGIKRQADLHQVSVQTGIRICGPNTDGVVNAWERLTLGFHGIWETAKLSPGPIGIVSQSGAMISSILNRVTQAGLGYSAVVAAGNEVDLQLSDYLGYLTNDPQTRVILLFLEQVRDASSFIEGCRQARLAGKPIVALKAGWSELGRLASAAHTGAIAGSSAAYAAMFEQEGVIAVNSLEEMVAVAQILCGEAKPMDLGIAAVTVSGGMSALLADRAVNTGLALPKLAGAARRTLASLLPLSSPMNPYDVTGQASDHPQVLEPVMDCLFATPGVGSLIFALGLLPLPSAERWARVCATASASRGRPVYVYAMPGTLPTTVAEYFRLAQLPVFASLDDLLSAILKVATWNKRNALSRRVRRRPGMRKRSAELNGPALLRDYKIALTPTLIAESLDEAYAHATSVGFPVVAKLSTDLVAHRSRHGGVKMLIKSHKELASAFEDLQRSSRSISGSAAPKIEIQAMVRPGLEFIVGTVSDPTFGPILMVGAGGQMVEVMRDTAVRPCPITRSEGFEMLRGLRIVKSANIRGRTRPDWSKLCDVMVRLSWLAIDHADSIKATDLNPVIVHERNEGVDIVDQLFVFARH